MDHVSGTTFHGESISSAPKDFAVYVSDFSRVGGGGVRSIRKRGVNMGQRVQRPAASSWLPGEPSSLELYSSFIQCTARKAASGARWNSRSHREKELAQCAVLDLLGFQSQRAFVILRLPPSHWERLLLF